MKRKAAANLRETSLKDLKPRTTVFCNDFGNCSISKIEKCHLMEWFEGLKLSQRGKLNYWRRVRQIFSWAKNNDFILDDPFDHISKDNKDDILGREDEKLIEIYKVKEAQLLLEATIGEDILPIWVIGFFCGVRVAEVFRLRWEDIRIEEEDPFVTIYSLNAKSRSLRNVDLHPTALEWLSLCNR